jgi:hemoglobin
VSHPDEPSLYLEIGGAAGVEDIVAGLYALTMADPDLAPFFADSSLPTIVAHQHELIAGALGGPSAYTGRSLREAHAGMAIEPVHFRALTTHLVEAMEACGVAPTVTDRVTAVITRLWYAQQWPHEAAPGEHPEPTE